ncbi:COG1470 family protein [Streptomyces sp. NPDC055085]
MGVEITLTPQNLDAEPGQAIDCQIELYNNSSVVDQFSIELIGPAIEWASIEPEIVNLFPDGQASATLTFNPPRSSEVKSGDVPFAVRVTSREDPEGSRIEEGVIHVQEFKELGAEFIPTGSHGSFRTRHRLAVDNLSNHDISASIKLLAPDDGIVFKIAKYAVDIKAGTTVIIPVSVIPKKRFFKGRNKTHAFQAILTSPDIDPVTADAAMVQKQLLPKWLFAGLMSLLALAATLGILSATVFKESLQSDETPQPPASQASSSASTPTPSGETPSNSGQPTGDSPTPSSSESSQTTPDNTTSGTVGAPEVIQANASAGQSGTFQQFNYTVPSGQTFNLTDVTISSPPGSTGTVKVEHGSDTLVSQDLDNLQTTTKHLDQPLEVGAGDSVILAVDCHNETNPCTPTAILTGQIQ